MIYLCTNIKYDTDGETIEGLPDELDFEIDDEDFDPEYELADMITDKTGWCVLDFNYKIVVPNIN